MVTFLRDHWSVLSCFPLQRYCGCVNHMVLRLSVQIWQLFLYKYLIGANIPCTGRENKIQFQHIRVKFSFIFIITEILAKHLNQSKNDHSTIHEKFTKAHCLHISIYFIWRQSSGIDSHKSGCTLKQGCALFHFN